MTITIEPFIGSVFSHQSQALFPKVPHEPLTSPFFRTAFTPSAGPTLLIDEINSKSHRYPDLCHVCQPCVRYWDLPNVGDKTHLSFFEMVACSSFLPNGRWTTMEHIFKFLTTTCSIPPDRFWATRFGGGNVLGCGPFPEDTVAIDILHHLDIPDSRIVDVAGVEGFVANSMEPIGGYRCELYVDLGTQNLTCNQCLPGLCTCGRFLELVTSVAYEFEVLNRDSLYSISPLPKQFMHATGFGVERLESILEGSGIIHHTPRFRHLMPFVNQIISGFSLTYPDQIRLVDTLCALLFLHADGATTLSGKSNRSRRWVLNKWIKQARSFHSRGVSILPLLDEIKRWYSPRYAHIQDADTSLLLQLVHAQQYN
ncbi:MAG: alanine--tRNA ligase-related protein [Cyanobacteriota bacterium]|nr:alanine--tRNA ligase-related protein [Cyanobacteriota bacterium]